MQNIRISLNLLAIAGARIVRMIDASNQPKVYVAIPCDQLFVPSDRPEPKLMGTMIHTPNAQYGDFMIKTYMSNADYKMLSKEEQMNLPVIGKGTFMQADPNRLLSRQAETTEAQDVDLSTIPTTQPTQGSTATLPNTPSPSVARSTTPAAKPYNMGTAPTEWPTKTFIVDAAGQGVAQCESIDAAINEAPRYETAHAIEVWRGNTKVERWEYDAFRASWFQVAVNV